MDAGGGSQAKLLYAFPSARWGAQYSSIVRMFGLSLHKVVGAPSVADLYAVSVYSLALSIIIWLIWYIEPLNLGHV